MRIAAGYGAGSVDDAWARLIAPHMAKNIPGNHSIIVQNMPGASSMIAANYVFKIAKPDGLTLGGVRASLYFDQLVGRKEVQFDWSKFVWLGSPTQSNSLLYMRANTPYKTIYEVRKAAVAPDFTAESRRVKRLGQLELGSNPIDLTAAPFLKLSQSVPTMPRSSGFSPTPRFTSYKIARRFA